LTFGIILGIFLGGIPSLIFREIVNSHQTVLTSISLTLILGVLLGFFAIHLVNEIFAANDKPLLGVLLGIGVSLLVVFYIEGLIEITDPDMYMKPMAMYPIIYGGVVGGEIGSIVFPILGVTRVIKDIYKNNQEAREYENRWKQAQAFIDKYLSQKEKGG
jgi:hypothetical protein